MFSINRILANYMVWHLVKPLISELSKPFRDASLEMLKVEKGVEGGAPPWKSCVTKTNSVMGFATGYLYIKERSGKNAKKAVGITYPNSNITILPTVFPPKEQLTFVHVAATYFSVCG